MEVSGRKGLGVKADDLLDRLEAAARAEVDARHAEAPEAEARGIAHAIAIGALRYFLLKFTRTAIIAFDFQRCAEFRRRDRPVLPIRRGARAQHLPQSCRAAAGFSR